MMCISKLGILTFNNVWTTLIEDLIENGLKDEA